jgi:heavy metal sensor kinase
MFLKLINLYRNRLSVRLTVNYTALLLSLFLLVCWFFLNRLESKFIKDIDRLLNDEAREFTQELNAAEDLLSACNQYAATVFERKHYPLYFRLLDSRGNEIYAVDAIVKKRQGRRLDYPGLRPEDKSYFTFNVLGRKPFRCYQSVIPPTNGEEFILQMITPTRYAKKTLEKMQRTMLLILPVLLVLSILIGLSASRRPFVIMRRLNAVTRRITAKNLQERLPVPKIESEVRELTETINDMLGRLEASFNEVRQFTADVAHELRNPLCAIQGEMEVVLSRERSAAEYHDMAAEALVRINGLIKIINDLFLISRFDNHKVLLEKEQVDFAAVVQDLYEFFEPVARENQIDLTLASCGPINALLDRTHIQQLVSNLIDNALKFTPAGESVTLHLEQLPGWLVLKVVDTGIGVPAEDIPHIFERFYQADKTRSAAHRGSGLGLQICKRIAEAHGGEIAVSVNEHKGVTFTLRLPCQQQELGPLPDAAP